MPIQISEEIHTAMLFAAKVDEAFEPIVELCKPKEKRNAQEIERRIVHAAGLLPEEGRAVLRAFTFAVIWDGSRPEAVKALWDSITKFTKSQCPASGWVQEAMQQYAAADFKVMQHTYPNRYGSPHGDSDGSGEAV